jgi:hypothetical protein
MGCQTATALADDDATTRAINAEPWQPLPGMVKLRCGDCRRVELIIIIPGPTREGTDGRI